MIRFCDKEVYNILEGDMTKSQMIRFFLQEKDNRFAALAVYREDGTRKGIITYRDLIASDDLDDCINTDVIGTSGNFWTEAKEYFERNADGLLTVVNEEEEILGFSYDDNADAGYSDIVGALGVLKNTAFSMPEKYRRVQMVVITDLNELAWKSYELFKNRGYKLCVMGEKWEWFGLKSGEGYLDYPDYAKMYIYAEGTKAVRNEIEYMRSYYEPVGNSFSFVYDIVNENEKAVYQKAAEYFQKIGVEICECMVPDSISELKIVTEDEKKSSESDLDISYYREGRTYSDEMINCLYRIYGRENMENQRIDGDEKVEWGVSGGLCKKMLKDCDFDKKIYLIGPCIAEGHGCKAEDALYGQLQKQAYRYGYQVIAVVILNSYYLAWQEDIFCLPVREKDIVLCINNASWFPKGKRNGKVCDLRAAYNRENRKSMFCHVPIHTNSEGNRLIAEELMWQYLTEKIKEKSKVQSNRYLQKGEVLNEDGIRAVYEYTEQVRRNGRGKTGAIVMNCNPFTNGHRYLVEYASKCLDHLYLFVVEEDRSFFQFKDRFEMVKKGTKDLNNVYVVPSGSWVLSYQTMSAYFEKETTQNIKIDASYDLEVFARYVAPRLGITIRFVGEEPLDRVTRQYNEQMKEIFPLFGIELKEIKRRQMSIRGGYEPISASKVRELMREEKWEEVRGLVPESTYHFCRKYGSV